MPVVTQTKSISVDLSRDINVLQFITPLVYDGLTVQSKRI